MENYSFFSYFNLNRCYFKTTDLYDFLLRENENHNNNIELSVLRNMSNSRNFCFTENGALSIECN